MKKLTIILEYDSMVPIGADPRVDIDNQISKYCVSDSEFGELSKRLLEVLGVEE